MKRVYALTVIGLLMLLAAMDCAAETKSKPMTAQQAEVRAREFCKQVGWIPIGRPKYKLEPAAGTNGEWEVEFPEKGRKDNTITIRVDRQKGCIGSAWSSSAGDRLELSSKVTLTDKQAEEAALKFLKIAGTSMDGAKLNGVTKESNTYPASDLRLEVSYSRYYKGVKFSGDGANVAVNPRDGSLVNMYCSFDCPLPEKITPAVDRDAAVKIATEYIKDKRKIDGLKSAELLITWRDAYVEGKIPKQSPPGSKLVWLISFIWDRAHEADVVLDADTGKVLTWSSCM